MEKVREQTKKRVEKHRIKEKEEKIQIKEENQSEIQENPAYISTLDKLIESDEKSGYSSNVTVTEQNKTEKKNKNKIENKNDSENKVNNKSDSKNNMEIDSESECGTETNSFSTDKNNVTEKEKINEFDIIEYIKKVCGKIKGSNLNSIKSAVCAHGGENVKLAIDKALEVNRPRMNYINGILNNWQIEGYPENGSNSRDDNFIHKSKNHKVLSFNNFEPRTYDYEKLEKELLGW